MLFVVLSWNSLSGVLVSFAAGRALGMLIRFMLGTQTNGAWGNQVAQALRSIGIDVASLSRRLATYTDSGMLKTTLDDDLTENSRIYDASTSTATNTRYPFSITKCIWQAISTSYGNGSG